MSTVASTVSILRDRFHQFSDREITKAVQNGNVRDFLKQQGVTKRAIDIAMHDIEAQQQLVF